MELGQGTPIALASGVGCVERIAGKMTRHDSDYKGRLNETLKEKKTLPDLSVKMFSRGILQTRPEVFHPDYFVVRMCCQGHKPGKLVSIRFVWNITRSQIGPLPLSGARFEGLEAGEKIPLWPVQFILGNFSFCGSLMQICQIWKMGGKNAKHLQ